ncbi:(4Fe-4S)-binding protein [Rapidithrix thailandica]|uniref:(4Fe-4S)-binding protein n=1 Tax=Rapidithrix thailandica TaxID=413964 RepID=A0AAW9S5Y2_9BACT
MEVKKEYSNGEVTIVWKPKVCMHSGICVHGLPNVFDPDGKPWINVKGAGTEEMIAQVKQCPSGALSYYMNQEEGTSKATQKVEMTKILVAENGPLIVQGTIKVVHKDGTEEQKSKSTAFCRCGSSQNKPFCDGSHKKVAFKG